MINENTKLNENAPKGLDTLTCSALANVIIDYPNLGISGFWHKTRITLSHLKEERVELSKAVNEVDESREWIRKNCRKKKGMNMDRSSYGLKHNIEKENGYISNGACIAAFIAEGYKLHHFNSKSLNCYFNVSF